MDRSAARSAKRCVWVREIMTRLCAGSFSADNAGTADDSVSGPVVPADQMLISIAPVDDNAEASSGCLFKSLADSWCDSTTPGGRLMLTVLGGLAEFERDLIKARTTEGRERAKRSGVKMGRKPKLSLHQIAEVRVRKAGGESVRFLARSYGCSPNTISRVR
jgi:hypothetical protein